MLEVLGCELGKQLGHWDDPKRAKEVGPTAPFFLGALLLQWTDCPGSLLPRRYGSIEASDCPLSPLGNLGKSGYRSGLKGLEALIPEESINCYK